MPVRAIRDTDYPELNQLLRSVGWAERSLAGWRWLADNPARAEINAPVGWVTVDEADRPVAMVGNFIQRFLHGPRIRHGASGHSLIVPRERTGASRGLIRAALNQPGLFARYTFSANPKAAPLYRPLGMVPFPGPTHDLKLSWIVDPLTCLQARFLRMTLGGLSARTVSHLGERLMNSRVHLPGRLKLAPGVVPLRDLSEQSDYAGFWRTLVAEAEATGRLLADRSPRILRWRLADPDLTVPPVVLGLKRDGQLVGYLMAALVKPSAIEAPTLEIIDLAALDSAPDALEVLTRSLIDSAYNLGAARVRLGVTTPDMLDQLGALPGRARREGGWGHAHVGFSEPELADAWNPTPFDGDHGITARPAPLPADPRQRMPKTVSATPPRVLVPFAAR